MEIVNRKDKDGMVDFFVICMSLEFMMRVLNKSLLFEDIVFVCVFVVVGISLWVLLIFGKGL